MNEARMPYDYIPDPEKGRPLFNAKIYFGIPDLDPQIPANQIDVYGIQEDGSSVLLSQPISTGSGGIPMLNGSPIYLGIDEFNYSFKALDRNDDQIYYTANVSAIINSSSLRLLVRSVETIADLEALVPDFLGQQASVYEYNLGTGIGGGSFVSIANTTRNGFTIFNSGSASYSWKRINYKFLTASMAGAREGFDSYSQLFTALNNATSQLKIDGAYTTSETIVISNQDLLVYADTTDHGITKIGDVDDVIEISSGSNNINLLQLHVIGNAVDATTATWSVHIVTASTTENFSAQLCRFSGANNGVNTGNSNNFNVSNNKFDSLVGVTSGRGYGILGSGQTKENGKANFNEFYGEIGTSGRHAIYWAGGGTNLTAIGNKAYDFNQGVYVLRANDDQPGMRKCSFRNNYVYGGGTNATTDSAAIGLEGNLQDCIASGNEVYDFNNGGIYCTYSDEGATCINNEITNNIIARVSQRGIRAMGTKSCKVVGNIVIDASYGNSGTYAGIVVGGGASGDPDGEVADNTLVKGNTVVGSYHRSAFQMNVATPLSTNTMVDGNTFMAGVTAGLAVELNETSGIVVDFQNNATNQTFSAGGTDSKKQDKAKKVTLNFGSVSANSSLELTTTLNGVTTGGAWAVTVTPVGTVFPNTGLSWMGYVSASNTVTVRLVNATVAAIDPASIDWVIEARRYT
jgi:hypothetical protein